MISQIALAEDFVHPIYCQTVDMVAESKMVSHIDSVFPKWEFEHPAFMLLLKAQHFPSTFSQVLGKKV